MDGLRTVGLAAKAAGLLAAGALVAACSSSTHTSASTGSNPAGAGGGGSTAPGAAVALETHSGPMGSFLTDSHGKALYLFSAETSTTSACDSACQKYWPPLTTTATATAMSGVQASLIATVAGPNGTMQVTYGGHRLYYYASDSAPGDTLGQGSDNFGAKWWLLTPSGQPITSTSGGGSSSASSSAGGGGGGWS